MSARHTSRRVRKNVGRSLKHLTPRGVMRDLVWIGFRAGLATAGFYSTRMSINVMENSGLSATAATVGTVATLPLSLWALYKFGPGDGDSSYLSGACIALADRAIGSRIPLLTGGT